MSCVEALTLSKIKQHLPLLRPFYQLIKIILYMLSICITFNFPKHFCVVRKLQHLACYVIIQIIDIY